MMKKLYRNILIFLSPFILFVLFLFIRPYDKEFAYHKITGSCSADWIYHRIIADTTKIDIAFLGSSKTLNGINDVLIRHVYTYDFYRKVDPVNISFCGFGRNIKYCIAKELFKHKKPDILFLEIREREHTEGHISFGVVADSRDLLTAPLWFNKHYFRDLFQGVKARYDYLVFGKDTSIRYSGPNHGYLPNDMIGDSLKLLTHRDVKLATLDYQTPDFQTKYAYSYLKKIIRMAEENNCRIIFMYLPSFGFAHNQIEHEDFYRKHGEIWYTPEEIQDNPGWWKDNFHLSRQGADSLSSFFLKQLTKEYMPEAKGAYSFW